jgi:hypothetical protein
MLAILQTDDTLVLGSNTSYIVPPWFRYRMTFGRSAATLNLTP